MFCEGSKISALASQAWSSSSFRRPRSDEKPASEDESESESEALERGRGLYLYLSRSLSLWQLSLGQVSSRTYGSWTESFCRGVIIPGFRRWCRISSTPWCTFGRYSHFFERAFTGKRPVCGVFPHSETDQYGPEESHIVTILGWCQKLRLRLAHRSFVF